MVGSESCLAMHAADDLVVVNGCKIRKMRSEAPSWVDQWGAGGFGAMEDDAMRSQNDTTKNKKDKSGFASKAKTAALVCVQKIRTGTYSSVKWIKHKCQRTR
ncbi:hypothetical protein K1719_015767 [Acacia pycnantha]|nr:hypothetical protein K1719_015767 [Acacia pycnantha]